MRSMIFVSASMIALILAAGGQSFGQTTPQFQVSKLAPPDPTRPAAASLFDLLSTDDVSPLGTTAASVKPEDLITSAEGYLNGTAGRPNNTSEAAYWLKRAIAMAPDETGKKRAWAVTQLALLVYGNPNGHAAARSLWELAAAWKDPDALYNLGALTEVGDDATKADPRKAHDWYERASKAGNDRANDALARLKLNR